MKNVHERTAAETEMEMQLQMEMETMRGAQGKRVNAQGERIDQYESMLQMEMETQMETQVETQMEMEMQIRPGSGEENMNQNCF